jgi:hypothetical protein
MLALPCYAATKATTASLDKGISGGVVGIGDLSSGDTAEVDSDGNLLVKEYVNKKITISGDRSAIISGAFTLMGVVVKGVTAGDYMLIYDALTATGNPVLDIYVGTATDTKVVTLPAGGIPFTTGLSTDSTDDDVIATAIYK